MLFFALGRMPLLLYLLTAVTIAVVGVWASDRAEALFAKKDDGRIVIDEVAGQLLTLIPVAALAEAPALAGSALAPGNLHWWVLVVTGFVTFRVLDIWKPGPVGWAERSYEGGLGVMADDLLAGVIGAVLMAVPCFALLLIALSEVI